MARGLFILLVGFVTSVAAESGPATGLCVMEKGGCRDLTSNKVYVSEDNKLVDPETKDVYVETPVDTTVTRRSVTYDTVPYIKGGAPTPRSEVRDNQNASGGGAYGREFDAPVSTPPPRRSPVPPEQGWRPGVAIDPTNGQAYPTIAPGLAINPATGGVIPTIPVR